MFAKSAIVVFHTKQVNLNLRVFTVKFIGVQKFRNFSVFFLNSLLVAFGSFSKSQNRKLVLTKSMHND